MSGATIDALAALVCYGLGDVIYKRAARSGLTSGSFLMGQAWFFCPAVVVYAWLTGTFVWRPAALWGSAAGLAFLIGFYNYARSLRSGSVSVIAPVFRLNFIVTAALAITLLGEPLTTRKLAGFLLALTAGWLLLGGAWHRDGGNPAATRRALGRVLVATSAVGAANFFYKLGLIGGATPETMLVAQALVFCSLVTVTTCAANRTLRPPRGFAWHSGPAAVTLLAASLFLLHGLKHGEASVIVPITQMGFVVAAVLGVAVFGEGWTGRKVGGLCAAVAALALLALG
ncbi:MAG: EamA family transporter [Stellaceae bacterium]